MSTPARLLVGLALLLALGGALLAAAATVTGSAL